MRSAAQVAPDPFPGAGIEVVVGGQLVAADLHDVGVAGLVVDQFELVGLAGQLGAGLVLGLVDPAVEQLAFLDDLAHPLLERLEVLRGERLGHVEVVVEAVGDRRADAELGLREELLHRLRQDVGGGVPDHAAAVVGVGGHRDHLDVGLRHPAEVAQFPVGVAHHHDGVGLPAARQAGLAHGRARGGPGSNPDRGCGDGGRGGAHHGISFD